MPSDDDRALLSRIATGDESALRQLYTTYRPALHRYLWYQMHHDLPQVEDVMQETFLSIWRAAHTVRQGTSIAAWIFQIAHRHVLQSRRVNARRREDVVFELDDERDVSPRSLEDDIVTRIDLDEALRTLSDKYREILYLICLQGFSLYEVAEILAIPLGTVKSRLSNARRALQRSLARMQIMEGK
ncbi:MAG TPA: RNA polymerase sigma factor [Ktedonobacterales bacterium]|nr:RNA polymerase sigma factor [Ktedonobacterales bacterium]